MSELKADYNDWVQATVNLKERRKARVNSTTIATGSDIPTHQNPVADYRLHLIKCGYGKSILDVGCGAQFLKTQIPSSIKYTGIDAFPAEGYEESTIQVSIEYYSESIVLEGFDTVCAFAVLDNCLDFDKAIRNMKQIAKQNIIILTGIGIEVDSFHTFRLEMIDFDSRFTDWRCTHREEIAPKVFLLNYER